MSSSSSSSSSSLRLVQSSAAAQKKQYARNRARQLEVELRVFFAPDSDALAQMLPVVRGSGPLSVRVLNWFVSNYAKLHQTAYHAAAPAQQQQQQQLHASPAAAAAAAHAEKKRRLLSSPPHAPPHDAPTHAPTHAPNQGAPDPFVVWTRYSDACASYRDKHLFDPFCRNSFPVVMTDCEGGELSTSVAQLNFFRWVIRNRVLDYVLEHHAEIVADLNLRLPRTAAPAANATAKRSRKEITASGFRSMRVIKTKRGASPPPTPPLQQQQQQQDAAVAAAAN